jgi:hypothetical protein
VKISLKNKVAKRLSAEQSKVSKKKACILKQWSGQKRPRYTPAKDGFEI